MRYIAADTVTGYAFSRDSQGKLLTSQSAKEYADIMNSHEGSGKYQVFLVCGKELAMSNISYVICAGCLKSRKSRNGLMLVHNKWDGKKMICCPGSGQPKASVKLILKYLKD